MSIKLNIVNAMEKDKISVEVDEFESAGDIIVFASQYWKKEENAYVMKVGSRLVPSSVTVSEMGLKSGDTVTLVPDPQGG